MPTPPRHDIQTWSSSTELRVFCISKCQHKTIYTLPPTYRVRCLSSDKFDWTNGCACDQESAGNRIRYLPLHCASCVGSAGWSVSFQIIICGMCTVERTFLYDRYRWISEVCSANFVFIKTFFLINFHL